MLRVRVIPCLLLSDGQLVKTVKFKNAKYIGDPINAVHIFNEKEVDELVFLDISATPAGKEPDYDLIKDIAGEAFMPLSYGGGITHIEQIKRLYKLGVEKIIMNTAATNASLVSEAASIAGCSGVVVSMDVRRNLFGKYSVYVAGGKRDTKRDPVSYAREIERCGAGEILLNAIDRDGTLQGYDLELISQVTAAVNVPVVAVGGAGDINHFRQAVDCGAAAVGAGSLFVLHGRHRAVLITYPEYHQLEQLFNERKSE